MASGVTYDDGDCGNDPQEEDQNFHQVMEQLGASTVIEGLVGTVILLFLFQYLCCIDLSAELRPIMEKNSSFN